MADIALSSKATTAVIVGGYVYIIIPDGGSPTGFTGRRISITDLLAALQAEVDTNTANIATNTTNITTLQNNSSKRLDLAQVSSFSFTQEGGSVIEDIYFSGTGTVSVGTTLAGEQLVSSRLIEGGIRRGSIKVSDGYTATSRTIYITLSAASVDVATFSKLSLFT
jgi:hypothetical protein